jgi:DNA repair protein RadC
MNSLDFLHHKKSQNDFLQDLTEEKHLTDDWEILTGLLECKDENFNAGEVAFSLLQEFGNLPSVLSQSPQALRRLDDVTDEIANKLLLVRRAATLIAEKRILKKPALNNWQAIENYCRTVIGYHGRQNVMAIFLDDEFQPMRCEQISKGTVNNVSAYPREIITRLLELDAYSLIIAKNIPSGRLTPKDCEIAFADKLQSACELLDVYLMDAVLVGKGGARSLLRS